MIEPPPAARMPGIAAWVVKKCGRRLIACISPSPRPDTLDLVAQVVGGVVDQHGDRAVRRGRLRHRRLQGGDVGDVAGDEQRRGCRGVRRPRRQKAVASERWTKATCAALGEEAFGQRRADAGAAAGDEDRLAVKVGEGGRLVILRPVGGGSCRWCRSLRRGICAQVSYRRLPSTTQIVAGRLGQGQAMGHQVLAGQVKGPDFSVGAAGLRRGVFGVAQGDAVAGGGVEPGQAQRAGQDLRGWCRAGR